MSKHTMLNVISRPPVLYSLRPKQNASCVVTSFEPGARTRWFTVFGYKWAKPSWKAKLVRESGHQQAMATLGCKNPIRCDHS